jgi:hypothetical protein
MRPNTPMRSALEENETARLAALDFDRCDPCFSNLVYCDSLPIFHCRVWKYFGASASIYRRGRKARQFRLETDDPRGFLNRPERGKVQRHLDT